MDFDTYQAKTRETATYPDAFGQNNSAVNYCLVGLAGEVGEIMNKWKKILRRDGSDNVGITAAFREDMRKELGDVLWYLARAAEEFGIDFDVIAEYNITKLASRKARGVIQGNGDDR